jgi:hypothetical protein
MKDYMRGKYNMRGEKMKAYKTLVGISEGKTPCDMYLCRFEDDF